jgi:hypothetical protein
MYVERGKQALKYDVMKYINELLSQSKQMELNNSRSHHYDYKVQNEGVLQRIHWSRKTSKEVNLISKPQTYSIPKSRALDTMQKVCMIKEKLFHGWQKTRRFYHPLTSFLSELRVLSIQ